MSTTNAQPGRARMAGPGWRKVRTTLRLATVAGTLLVIVSSTTDATAAATDARALDSQRQGVTRP